MSEFRSDAHQVNQAVAPGLQHAAGAVLLQALFALVGARIQGVSILAPHIVAWAGVGSIMFFVGREWLSCERKFGTRLGVIPRGVEPRTWRDVAWAVLPVAALAVALPML